MKYSFFPIEGSHPPVVITTIWRLVYTSSTSKLQNHLTINFTIDYVPFKLLFSQFECVIIGGLWTIAFVKIFFENFYAASARPLKNT